MTFDIDTKGVECVKFLNPLGLKGQSVIGVVLARSVDGHDEDIICPVVRLAEMSGDWFVTFVFGILTVLKESSLLNTFGFSTVLENNTSYS